LNDDLGKDYMIGLKQALGDKAASMIVAEAAYEATDPTVDSQIVRLKTVGADLLYNNGRKISLIAYDDAYNPAKTVEQTRKLVESDEVLLIFQSLGSAANAATQKYLNDRKVPQLFLATGGTRFSDPVNFPWKVSTLYNKPTRHQTGAVECLLHGVDSPPIKTPVDVRRRPPTSVLQLSQG
jgi:Periplasmic binding protein